MWRFTDETKLAENKLKETKQDYILESVRNDETKQDESFFLVS
jgi:hypothetical protein